MEVIKTLKIKATEEELKKMYEKTNELFLENDDEPFNSFEEWKNYFTEELLVLEVEDYIEELQDNKDIAHVIWNSKIEIEKI